MNNPQYNWLKRSRFSDREISILSYRERKTIFRWIGSIVQTQSMHEDKLSNRLPRTLSIFSQLCVYCYFPLQWEPGKTLFPSLASTLGGQRSGGWWGERRNPDLYLSWWPGYQVVYQEGLWERRWESSWQYLYFSRLEWSVVYWVLRQELKQTWRRRQRENLKM